MSPDATGDTRPRRRANTTMINCHDCHHLSVKELNGLLISFVLKRPTVVPEAGDKRACHREPEILQPVPHRGQGRSDSIKVTVPCQACVYGAARMHAVPRRNKGRQERSSPRFPAQPESSARNVIPAGKCTARAWEGLPVSTVTRTGPADLKPGVLNVSIATARRKVSRSN